MPYNETTSLNNTKLPYITIYSILYLILFLKYHA